MDRIFKRNVVCKKKGENFIFAVSFIRTLEQFLIYDQCLVPLGSLLKLNVCIKCWAWCVLVSRPLFNRPRPKREIVKLGSVIKCESSSEGANSVLKPVQHRNYIPQKAIAILESFGATNCICDLHETLSKLSKNDKNIVAMNEQSNNTQGNFNGQKSLPYNLKYSQLRERGLHNGVTKQLQKKLAELNQKCINLARSRMGGMINYPNY